MSAQPADAAGRLLQWYDERKRILPWRDTGSAYATWVSEIMLQQTRVETVIPYFLRFMADFPTVSALANAPEDAVLKRWEGLGYYSRARNLHRGAKQVASEYGGALPRTAEELRKITGIGPYTAGAIASIAFGERTAAVDGNVIRVVSRLTRYAEPADTAAGKAEITRRTEALMPPDRPGDFNQALMDLGATVCLPAAPDCERCPLRGCCAAFAAGDPRALPVLTPKKPPKPLDWDVVVLRSGNRALLRRRTEQMLRGLWVFPMAEGHREEAALAAELQAQLGLPVRNLRRAGEARHVFTHQIWRMNLWEAETDPDAAAPAGCRFASPAELDALALPTAMKAARALAEQTLRGEP